MTTETIWEGTCLDIYIRLVYNTALGTMGFAIWEKGTWTVHDLAERTGFSPRMQLEYLSECIKDFYQDKDSGFRL